MKVEKHISSTHGHEGDAQASEVGRNLFEEDYLAIGEYAEKLVTERGLKNISMSKLRSLHGEIARLRDMVMKDELYKCRERLFHLKLLLIYTYGRLGPDDKKDFREYEQTLTKTIDYILRNIENLKSSIEKLHIFSEAVIAYHKYHGGKE